MSNDQGLLELSVIILCGGQSRRMGRPKALLPWGDCTLIEFLVQEYSSWAKEVIVVCSEDLTLPELQNAELVIDQEPAIGPLMGIYSGLQVASADYSYVAAVDMPFISKPYVEHLFSQKCATAPIVDSRIQPIQAIYPTAAKIRAKELLDSQQHRPRVLLEELSFKAIEGEELKAFLPSLGGFNDADRYMQDYTMQFPKQSTGEIIVEWLGTARSRSNQDTTMCAAAKLKDVLLGLNELYPEIELIDSEGRMATNYLYSLNGEQFVQHEDCPIMPGERLLILDATVGG